MRPHEDRWRDLEHLREFVVTMRHTDSALRPISDSGFAEGLAGLDRAIAEGRRPRPEGVDLLVFSECGTGAGERPTTTPSGSMGTQKPILGYQR